MPVPGIDGAPGLSVTVCNVTRRNKDSRTKTGRHSVRHESTHALTDLQQAFLDYLWSHGPATAERIREGLQTSHPLKDSSVRTVLRRLESRGLVTHTVDGRTFVYQAGRHSQELAAGVVRQIIRRFFSGSVEQLLVGMVDEKVLSAEELERLARRVRQRR